MAAYLRDFWMWWLATIGGMFRRDRAECDRADGVITIGRDGFRLAKNGDGQEEAVLVDAAALATALAALRKNKKRPLRSVIISLEQDRYVLRHMSDFALPESRHKAMALLDLFAATPFRPETVHLFATTRATAGASGSSYAIVKRSIVDPLTDALRQAHVRIAGFEFGGTQEGTVLTAGERDVWTSSPGREPSRFFMRTGVALLFLGAAATAIHRTMAFDDARAKAETAIAALAADAKKVRAALDSRAAAVAAVDAQRANLKAVRPASEIWEELARVLPDSAHLTDLTIKDGRVAVIGFSETASSIIVALEGSPLFEEVQFTSPVVKVPGQDGERFAAELRVVVN